MVSPMIRYRLPSIARRSVIVDRYPQRPSTGPKPGKQSRRNSFGIDPTSGLGSNACTPTGNLARRSTVQPGR